MVSHSSACAAIFAANADELPARAFLTKTAVEQVPDADYVLCIDTDHVYSADPRTDASATKLDHVTYQDALVRGLKVVDSTAFVKGEWGSEIVDSLAPQEGDVVVEGKRGLDTFATTNLDFILRSKGIETVAISGFLTNCCVESTMRSAYEKGFEVVTLTDCVGATSEEEHTNAITYDYPMFSESMTSAEFVQALDA